MRPDRVIADRAYTSREDLRRRGIKACIPSKGDHDAPRRRKGSRGGRPAWPQSGDLPTATRRGVRHQPTQRHRAVTASSVPVWKRANSGRRGHRPPQRGMRTLEVWLLRVARRVSNPKETTDPAPAKTEIMIKLDRLGRRTGVHPNGDVVAATTVGVVHPHRHMGPVHPTSIGQHLMIQSQVIRIPRGHGHPPIGTGKPRSTSFLICGHCTRTVRQPSPRSVMTRRPNNVMTLSPSGRLIHW
jgi:hypothetical protein